MYPNMHDQYRTILFVYIFTLSNLYGITVSITVQENSRNISSTTPELIAERGYNTQEYQVTTEDGYILTIYRINNTGPVVLLMHGLFLSSDDWLTLGPDALPFVLWDKGYDIYLGNARGNKYSRKHIAMTPNVKTFWNFSWHEIGYYDLPALIDFALETSNKTKLTYIGHSQGTTVFYVLASLKPEYSEKISLMISMATVAWVYHAKPLLFRFFFPVEPEADVTETVGIYDLLPYSGMSKFITTEFCPRTELTLLLCVAALFTVFGIDYPQLNYVQLPSQIGHIPSGAATKQVLHYIQLIEENEFRQYNYHNSNLEMYGTEVPPTYPVEKITVPIAIMHAENDPISVLRDVDSLISKLSKVVDFYTIAEPLFNHQDFLWAKDANFLVNKKVLYLVQKFRT